MDTWSPSQSILEIRVQWDFSPTLMVALGVQGVSRDSGPNLSPHSSHFPLELFLINVIPKITTAGLLSLPLLTSFFPILCNPLSLHLSKNRGLPGLWDVLASLLMLSQLSWHRRRGFSQLLTLGYGLRFQGSQGRNSSELHYIHSQEQWETNASMLAFS